MNPTTFYKNFISTPTLIFLIDGIGAIVSILFLGGILATFETHFGMPKHILYMLCGMAVFFATYSMTCYFFLKKRFSFYLKGIILLNTLYCGLTISLIFHYYPQLTQLGIIYFILELIVIFTLILFEIFVSLKLDHSNLGE